MGRCTCRCTSAGRRSRREAEAIAYEQWRSNVFAPPVCWDLETAEHFDVVSADVPAEQVAEWCNVSADLGRHVGWLEEYVELGFDQIALHHVGQEQRELHRRVRRGGAAEAAPDVADRARTGDP